MCPMITHIGASQVASLTTALVTVCVRLCGNDVLFMCVCRSGFGPRSFVIVTLLKVFVLSDGRDTEEAKIEST